MSCFSFSNIYIHIFICNNDINTREPTPQIQTLAITEHLLPQASTTTTPHRGEEPRGFRDSSETVNPTPVCTDYRLLRCCNKEWCFFMISKQDLE